MKRAINRFYRDERGVVVVMVGAIIALLLVFSVMAIDATQMMLVKTQLQNAADAGALAGALLGAMTSDTAVARSEAILAAGANAALRDSANARNIMSSVVIADSDVTFPQARRIQVNTHRTEATGDQFMNYFMRIFDENNLGPGNMTASAAADFIWVCGSNCLKPWAVPDRWCDSVGTGDCNDGNGVYEPGLGEFYGPVTTGYSDTDAGDTITIVTRQGQGQNAPLEPQYYNAVAFPAISNPDQGSPETGQSIYRQWIAGCVDENVTIEVGDILQIAPGAGAGNPQAQDEVQALIDADLSAYWDAVENRVISSNPSSPRIIKMALIDPNYGIQGAPGEVRVIKIVAMFLESVGSQGSVRRISGRFIRIAEPGGTACANQNDPGFLFKTALSQ